MSRFARRSLLILAVILGSRGHAAEQPIRVVTLNTVLTEVAREVGGDQAAVVGLVRPGVDPHTFSPSPADVRAMVDADLVLASGLNLEGYLRRLVEGASPRGRVLTIGDALPGVLVLPRSDGPSERDPHWWNSIANVILAAELVRAEFTRERPGSAELFKSRAQAYRARLGALQLWVSAEIARVDPARRDLVTSHDAFGYFARDYGFRVAAVDGLSTDAEADARQLAHLVDLIRRNHVRAVFVEGGANPSLVENLVRETGVRLGGPLFADGLGPAGSGAESYEAMYRHNVTAIVGALGP